MRRRKREKVYIRKEGGVCKGERGKEKGVHIVKGGMKKKNQEGKGTRKRITHMIRHAVASGFSQTPLHHSDDLRRNDGKNSMQTPRIFWVNIMRIPLPAKI